MSLDLILVGGGLSSGLIAWRLLKTRPQARFLIVEKQDRLGGNHTWSFHPSDIDFKGNHWMLELISKQWTTHSVRFPAYTRVFHSGYCSIGSDDFHKRLTSRCGDRILLNTEVMEISPHHIQVADGKTFEAAVVLDCRGEYPSCGFEGYQKFLGCFLRTQRPHGLLGPILMDATVPQVDGYRFIYTLPWEETLLLVEDTYYSDTSELNVDSIRERIYAYCAQQGWQIQSVDHEETGVLPIPWQLPPAMKNRIGLGGGLFHATTGFSLPDAVRVAEAVSALSDWKGLSDSLYKYSLHHRRTARYFTFLNKMLFWGVPATQRYKILQRFYRLPEPIIQRFYRGKLNYFDRAFVLVGRPPVPLLTMARNLWERSTNDSFRT